MKKLLFAAALVAALTTTVSCEKDYSIKCPVEHTPTMGWSSWNTFLLDINENVIKGQADAMVATGLADAGYKFINIDDGYQLPRDEQGNFTYNAELFPGGMRALADYIHSLGLKAGIYSDAGDNTCGSENKYPYGLGTGLWQHEEADCKLFFDEWDYDFIKVDFCGGQHAELDEKEQYTRISNAIKACEKQGIVFNICRWRYPGTWVKDLSLSWRTTYDIRPWFSRIKYIIEENRYLQAYIGDGHYNDCDMLEIGACWQGDESTYLSEIEEQTHMAYWCITSSPLLIGCNMNNIRQSSLDLMLNKDLIAMDQDCLGIGAPVVQREGDVYVVAKDMEAVMGPKRAVVVMNLSDEDRKIDLSVEALGFTGDINVYDCFTHEDRPELTCNTSFEVALPAHGSAAYFITGKRIEKSVYQGEEAYLNAFTTLEGHETACYKETESADQGAYAAVLGGNEDNWLEWKNVFSCKGGKYLVTLRYASAQDAAMTLTVNGEDVETFEGLNTGSDEGDWQTVNAYITLKKGLNSVRLGNAVSAMPNIDCMQLRRGEGK